MLHAQAHGLMKKPRITTANVIRGGTAKIRLPLTTQMPGHSRQVLATSAKCHHFPISIDEAWGTGLKQIEQLVQVTAVKGM